MNNNNSTNNNNNNNSTAKHNDTNNNKLEDTTMTHVAEVDTNNSSVSIEKDHLWLRRRPYFEATERDLVCENKQNTAIYRLLFTRI